MRRLIAIAALFLVTGSALAPRARAGAWLQKKGHLYWKLSAAQLETGKEYDASGDRVDILRADSSVTNTSYRDRSVTAYLEYGLLDWLTVVASVPYKYLTSARTEVSPSFLLLREIEAITGGLTDARLGVRVPVLRGRFPVSLQPMVKVPLFYDPTPENLGPPLGSGDVDVELSLVAGANLWPFPGYVGASAGYRVRGGDVDDEFIFSAEAGATWNRFFGKVGVDGLYSTEPIRELGVSSTTVVANEDVLKLMAELSYRLLGPLGVSVESFHTLSGRNTVAGTTWALGVWIAR